MSGIGKRVMESANSLAMSLGLYMVGHLAKPFRIADLEKLIGGYVDPEPQSSVGQGAEIYFEGADLWRAVERNEFVLHYQPQIEIKTGRVVGVEGLVRWQHPGQGIVLPGRFIESVEDLGLIDQLTLLVFHHGLSELDLFGRSDERPLTLSLNISALSLQNLDFVEAYGHEPSNMILEINESGLIRQLSRTLDVLTRLRMKHVQLSIDDFGIGYSMMDQLRNVPATEIKIDKSIVQNMHNDNSRVIIQKTIELGHDLGMRVTAEGVETQDQLNFLRAQHCDIVQGYLFSEPLSSARLLEWMAQYRPSRISSGH
jgi:EAL domain-containing protein (putative c-di-GMP-specific phosphodiesterase class I)